MTDPCERLPWQNLIGGDEEYGPAHPWTLAIARDYQERCQAWELVHRRYQRLGLAAREDPGPWFHAWDLLPGASVFVVHAEDRPVASLTVIEDGPLGLPCEEGFADIVDGLRVRGARLAEYTSLADSNALARGDALLRGMFRAGNACMRLGVVSDALIAVHPHHAPYYERSLCFQRLSEVRSFGKVRGAPAVLMRLDIEQMPMNYARAFGMGAGSNYIHYCQPNVKMRQLLAWIRRERRALGIHDVLRAVRLRPQVLDHPRLDVRAALLASYPGLGELLGRSSQAGLWERVPA